MSALLVGLVTAGSNLGYDNSMNKQLMGALDAQRTSKGFLTVEQVLALCDSGNVVLDPFSTLISAACTIGHGNIFYPSLVIECVNNGTLEIGEDNTFYPGCLLIADQGKLLIGNGNQFGDGGCTIKSNRPDALVRIGNKGRYVNGPTIVGKTTLGSGSQVIGAITVQDCVLEDGLDFTAQNPDEQGAVLKGYGLARGLTLTKGQVLNGQGKFDQQNVEQQSTYHPKTAKP